MSINRPDWGAPGSHPGGRETLPAVVNQNHEDRPTFTGQDLALIETPGDDLDATVASSIETGVFSREEAQKHYGYSDQEMDRGLAPPVSLAAIQRELAKIDKLRRTDKRAYFADEGTQRRERQLITLREKLKAQAAPATREASEYDGSGLPEDLLKQWEKHGGLEHNLKQAQATASAVLDALEPADAAAIQQSFDALPESAQTTIYGFMAVQGASWPAASDAAVENFASTPEGAEMVAEWGNAAARKLGNVAGRISTVQKAMKPDDRAKAEDFLDGFSSSQMAAVLRALGG